MATSTVSASINTEVKTIVAHRLQQAGTTANEVIRSLWDHIAATGQLPQFNSAGPQTADGEDSEAFQRLMELRAAVPGNTPLAHMSSADIKRELMMRNV